MELPFFFYFFVFYFFTGVNMIGSGKDEEG